MKKKKTIKITGWASEVYAKYGWKKEIGLEDSAIFVYKERPDKSSHWRKVQIIYKV